LAIAPLPEIIQSSAAPQRCPANARALHNLIAEPAADDPLVVDAINDYLKAIAASLLMEQVLAPRFEFAGCRSEAGFRLWPPMAIRRATNIGVNAQGQMHFEIKGLNCRPASRQHAFARGSRRSDRQLRAGQIGAGTRDVRHEVVPEELTS
jgi:hypothetical protein